MSLIGIGDVHGCRRTLEILLDRLDLQSDDQIVFVGDYVDRGPDSRGVIDLLLELGQDHDCVFLRGNHEAMMLDYLNNKEFDLWSVNGGVATLVSYLDDHQVVDIPPSHVDFLEQSVMYYDTPDFFFVHAGLFPELTIAENLEEADEEVFLWTRSHMRTRDYAWEKPVVCGHTPQEIPLNLPLLLNIDTGCVYHDNPLRGRLTAVRLPEREFISVRYKEEQSAA